MRKTLYLVLTLVMIVACLTGLAMAADKPAEANKADATWQAVENSNETVSYFAALDENVANWAVEIDGGVTFTLLKDITGTPYYEFPDTWSGDDSHPIVIDLNGHCITNTSTANGHLFLITGNSNLTIQNGSIIQTSGTNAIGFGTSEDSTHHAKLTLDNIFIYGASTAPTGYLIESQYKYVDLTLNKATIFTANTNNGGRVIGFLNSEAQSTLTCTGSVIGSKTQGAINHQGAQLTATMTDTAIVNMWLATFYTGTANSVTVNGKTVASWAATNTTGFYDGQYSYGILLPNGEATTNSGNYRIGYWGSVGIKAPSGVVTDMSAATHVVATSAGTILFSEWGDDHNFWASITSGGATAYALAENVICLTEDGKFICAAKATDGNAIAPLCPITVEEGKASAWNTIADGTGTPYSVGDSVPAGTVLYPCAVEGGVTVSFDSNGGSEVDSLFVASGSSFELPVPTKLGYQFAGWGVDSPYTVPNEGANLTATWTPNTYTLVLDANGENFDNITETLTYDVDFPLPTASWVIAGKAVDCWTTMPDGTGETFADFATVKNLTAENGATITLYAQWKVDYTAGVPTQDPAATATFKITDPEAMHFEYYYNDLTEDVIKWVTSVDGGATITLLKDITGTPYYEFPDTWSGDADHPIVIDLNGHCITNTRDAAGHLFYIAGNSNLTIQNGSIIQASGAYAIGTSGTSTFQAKLTLDNIFIYGESTSATVALIDFKYNNVELALNKATICTASASTGANGVISFANGETITLACTNSVIVGGSRAFGLHAGTLTATMENTAIVNDSLACVRGSTGTFILGDETLPTWADGRTANTAKFDSVPYYDILLPNGVTLHRDTTINGNYRVGIWGTLDLKAPAGVVTDMNDATHVVATSAGIILFSEWDATHNNWVKIPSGGATAYALAENVICLTEDGKFICAAKATDGNAIAPLCPITVEEGKASAWKDGNDNLYGVGASVPAGTVLYPCAVDGVTVSFDSNGGSEVESLFVAPGTVLNLPVPTKLGYQFAGWDGVFTYTVPNEDTTLTATWTPNTYNLELNANGESANSVIAKLTYDSDYTLPATPWFVEGKMVACWTTEPNGTGETFADFATVKNLTAENGATITLYAQWKTDYTNNATEKVQAQVPAAVATFKITLNADPSQAFYFADLNGDILEWAFSQDQGATITLLKDITGTPYYAFRNTWTDVDNRPIVIDLNGHCITSTSAAHLFLIYGHSNLTIQNGSIIKKNSAFAIGMMPKDGKYYEDDANQTPYEANVTLKNVFIYGEESGYGHALIASDLKEVNLTLDNAYLWSSNKANLNEGGVKRRGVMSFEYAENATVTATNSFIGTANDHVFGAFGGNVTVELTDTALASNSSTCITGNANAPVTLNGVTYNQWGTSSGSANTYENGKDILLPNGVLVRASDINGSNSNLFRVSRWGNNVELVCNPATVSEDAGNFMAVTSSGVVYFDALTTDVLKWANRVPGGVTFYMKDNVTHSAQAQFSQYAIAANPVVIDLNGYTLIGTGSGSDFALGGAGVLTIQNGTYTHTGGNASIYIGTAKTEASATVNFKNARVISTGVPVIYGCYTKANVNIDNSLIWSQNANFRGNITMEYLTLINLTIRDSIVGNDRNDYEYGHVFFFKDGSTENPVTPTVNLTVENAVFASYDGTLFRQAANVTLNDAPVSSTEYDKNPLPGATSYGGEYTITVSNPDPEAMGTITLTAPNAQYFGTANPVATAVAEVGGVRFDTLADAIAAATEGDEIQLLRDAAGEPIAIDKSLTLNFNGFTYTVNTADDSLENVLPALSVAEGLTVDLVNGTLNVSELVKQWYYVLVENKGANLTIENMVLDGTNLDNLVDSTNADSDESYVLTNQGGNVVICGETYIIANDEGTGYAFDVCNTANVTIDTTGYIGGAYLVNGGQLTINAGTFSQKPDSTQLAEGKTLVYGNGTYTVVSPFTIKNTMATLSLEDWVHVNMYTTFADFDKSFVEKYGGMLMWKNLEDAENALRSEADSDYKGLIASSNAARGYGGQSAGIPAAEYGNTIYLRAYLKLANGSYVYGPLQDYSVQRYCNNMLGKGTTSEKTKDVCAAMLKFGAAAQTYFGVNTENLVDKDVIHEIDTWNESLLNKADDVPTHNSIPADDAVSVVGKSLSLNDQIFANFYFSYTGNIKSAELLVWDGVSGELTEGNVSYTTILKETNDPEGNPCYGGQSAGFASKEYGKTIYVCAKFTDDTDNAHYSVVINYSPEQWVIDMTEKNAWKDNEEAMAQALVVYGSYAEVLFGR